jgi:two-component system, chemotaxis family, sensor kinase CheA
MSGAEIVKEFLVESYENLDRLDLDLIALEKNPDDRATLASIFRTIHTIKGTSGFLAFNQLESVTHVGENLLAKLRDGLLRLRPEITTALLAMVDAVRKMLAGIEATGTEGQRDDSGLIANLTQLLESGPGKATNTFPTARPAEVSPRAEADSASRRENQPKPVAIEANTSEAIHSADDAQGQVQSEVPLDQKAKQMEGQERTMSEQRAQSVSDSMIRVDVGQLDRLMNGMGELVLLRNQIMQYANSKDDRQLLGTSQRLNLLTTELQEGVMKTRMQPIDNIWSRFPRTVRDLALSCGKQVRIQMEGKETELDKTIIEAIKDPMTHLVRNAIDHGIETPTVRKERGKKPEGLVFLRAFHEGGQVNIEITDDGAGLDYEKIRTKALQKSVISADQAARVTERDLANLIFAPGLSTAEKVTNVSGRGVGMDVVKTNIEKIGGTVDVQSKTGCGTTVRLKIPLTLAIIPALIITTGGDRYAIPQVSLLELVGLEGEQVHKGIEQVNGAPVLRLRGCLLPLLYLNAELRVSPSSAPKPEAGLAKTSTKTGGESSCSQTQGVNIVVLRADDRQFGLVVDEINDTEEIVVKPLSKQLKIINGYAGATIMGDGRVALILDVLGLAQRANVVAEGREAVAEEHSSAPAAETQNKSNAVLLFQYGENGRMALDLALVARLEEFPRHTVEAATGQEVVQYRGQIMPLVRVSEVLGSRVAGGPQDSLDPLQVVVYSAQGRSVGLVVDRILDIVEEAFVVEQQSRRRGVVGSAVIQKRVTDILDVPGLIAAAERSQLLAGAHS